MTEARVHCTDASDAIPLQRPRQTGGRSLLDTLALRKSSREFSRREIVISMLSDLLWAAFGINRPDGHRTAPSTRNWQEIDVYVALARGLYLFNPAHSSLQPILSGDIRAQTGLQDFVAMAPVNLIYVADLGRMEQTNREEQRFYSALDAGFIAQNVYLFCASEGLATVVRGLIDRPALAARMGLRPEQRIVVAQSVGYPAGPAAVSG